MTAAKLIQNAVGFSWGHVCGARAVREGVRSAGWGKRENIHSMEMSTRKYCTSRYIIEFDRYVPGAQKYSNS